MAKRATLSAVPSYLPGTTSASAINSNDGALNAAFDNTLSRDGSTPNEMNADLDMNGNDILNAKNVAATDITVGGISLATQITNTATSATNAATSATAAAVSAAAALVSETNTTAALGTKVDKAGDTMTGLLVLSGDASTALGAVTKQQMDAADTLKAPLASPVFTGNPVAPTPLTADNDTSIATTAYVQNQTYETVANVALKAPLASPALTGNPTAPTAADGDGDTSIATTAFVVSSISTLSNKTLNSPIFSGIATAFESTGIDDNATSHALTIDALERILTGATVPDVVGASAGAVTISTGNSGQTTAHINADDLIIENNANAGISILTPNTSAGFIYFGDPESALDGRIQYTHTPREMEFFTAGVKAFTVDSTQRILTGSVPGFVGAEAGSVTITTGNSGLTIADVNADDLIIENDTHAGITIASPNTATGVINFGDPQDNNVGQLRYFHGSDTLEIKVGAAIKLTLDANTGTTAGAGSAGAGNQYVELKIGGVRYKLLHDGTL